MSKAKDITKLSFEEALGELEEIVRKLEAGGHKLEDSINDYTRGMALKKHAEKQLADAKLKVEKITQKNGELATEPFEAED